MVNESELIHGRRWSNETKALRAETMRSIDRVAMLIALTPSLMISVPCICLDRLAGRLISAVSSRYASHESIAHDLSKPIDEHYL